LAGSVSTEELEKLNRLKAHAQAVVARVDPLVGDPEEVVDEQGRKPRDRRPHNVIGYSAQRQCEVLRIREEVAKFEAERDISKDRAERAALRSEARRVQHRLRRLEEVPQLTADDMCADCERPLFQHGWVPSSDEDFCLVWPEHRAHILRVWEILKSALERNHLGEPQPAPAPKPQPLAAVPSGLSLAELISKLQEVQQQFPNAVVRRGRAGRFELGPASG